MVNALTSAILWGKTTSVDSYIKVYSYLQIKLLTTGCQQHRCILAVAPIAKCVRALEDEPPVIIESRWRRENVNRNSFGLE
ncbi:hypothetical protein GCM10007107_14780 [Shewanella indica]|nr:hypothetical protein GCM10007107_14780 [Shewanella indica]